MQTAINLKLRSAANKPSRFPSGMALVKGSYELVDVLSESGDIVLVERAGGQLAYKLSELEPYNPDVCPVP